jgi:hypothetical protein
MYGSISPTILVDQRTRNRSPKIVKHGLRSNTALGCRFLCPELPFCGTNIGSITAIYFDLLARLSPIVLGRSASADFCIRSAHPETVLFRRAHSWTESRQQIPRRRYFARTQ